MAEICFWRGKLTKSNLKTKKPKKEPNKEKVLLERRKIEIRQIKEEKKQALKKQRAEQREKERKSRDERDEILLGKLLAKKKKYRDRLLKIEGKFGKTTIEVEGVNASKALIAISKIARVQNVENAKDCVRFCVPSKQCHKIIALLQNLCYDYKIVNIGGVSPAIFRAFTRVGIAAGIVLGAVAFCLYSSFVTRVSVKCEGACDYALNAQIDGILKEYGAFKGGRIRNFDETGLCNAISALDKVAYVGVKRDGTHLTIVYKTALKKESFVSGNAKSVVASKRAVVTRVIVEGGTAVKKYGDVVDVGDTLIEGYIEYGDSKIPVEAKGYAFGKVYYKRTKYFANVEKIDEVVSTKKYTRFGIFSKMPKQPKSPFENFTLKTSVERFGFLLPLDIYTFEFEEIRTVERENALDLQGMKKALYSDLVADLNESASVLNAYYEVTQTEDGTYVTLTLEAEEII